MHWEDPEGWDGEGGGGWGSGWGTHVNPWLIHVNVWQKPLQYCKVISLQLIKINGKKLKKKTQKKGKERLLIFKRTPIWQLHRSLCCHLKVTQKNNKPKNLQKKKLYGRSDRK